MNAHNNNNNVDNNNNQQQAAQVLAHLGAAEPRPDNPGEEERNVRQNRGVQRTGPFRTTVPIGINNFVELRGRNLGVGHVNRFDRDRANIISLESLVQNGPDRRGVMLIMVLSIKREDGDNVETQKRYSNNARGRSKAKNHDRRLLGMCLNSAEGSNTFVMFQGHSINEKLFDADLSLRDNGPMRKLMSCLA